MTSYDRNQLILASLPIQSLTMVTIEAVVKDTGLTPEEIRRAIKSLRQHVMGRDSVTIHLAHRPLVPQPIAQCRRVWPSAVTVAFALGMALGVAAAVVTVLIRAGVTQ